MKDALDRRAYVVDVLHMFSDDSIARPGAKTEDMQIPAYGSAVPAGFPSPADDHLQGQLNVADLLVQRPAATFFCRAAGESMTGAGIQDGDLLVVDRSITAQSGDIVVATCDGGLTVKRLRCVRPGVWELAAANPAYPPLAIDAENGITIWGVVAWSLTQHCRR